MYKQLSESSLESSLKELGSVSSIIQSRSERVEKAMGELVTRVKDFPSVITQSRILYLLRVSNLLKCFLLPSFVSPFRSRYITFIGRYSSFQLSSLFPGLPSRMPGIPGLPSQLSSLIPGLPSHLSLSPFPSGLGLPSGLIGAMAQSLPSTLLSSLPSGLGLPSGLRQPWLSPCLLPFFRLYHQVLTHYPHWWCYWCSLLTCPALSSVFPCGS